MNTYWLLERKTLGDNGETLFLKSFVESGGGITFTPDATAAAKYRTRKRARQVRNTLPQTYRTLRPVQHYITASTARKTTLLERIRVWWSEVKA